ncbi:histidinol dehydrogenase [Tuberibacillus sp. Marseille-P3662]|uniref:histidinol dehydrogenase n=1 Tax=Tuberibacillus sp. Marseille-P3662 TaxID=1965358 RepID=UPI000A1C9EB4|nr:histidinol dehydrogenase [Tuberibacillus sp. Marseille-P3662]
MDVITKGELSFLKDRHIAGTHEQQTSVQAILRDVRLEGNKAVRRYTQTFDQVTYNTDDDFRVTPEEIENAYNAVPANFVQTIQAAAQNIKAFHVKQLPESWSERDASGTLLGQKVTPLDRVGVYVPGGTAAYPSSVLMGCIPALAAGVQEIALVSPPSPEGKLSPGVLVAAHEIGIDHIYKIGGAQAIGALAYGTETIQAVDKIVGPGNIYVALAKKEVFGICDIDSIAGPSEVVVLADQTAKPKWVAADLLSQAEHDKLSMAVLVTPDRSLAEAVNDEVERQVKDLPRYAIATEAIRRNGKILITESIATGIDLVNKIAPEHLEVVTSAPYETLQNIKHAGAIFIGPYSSEPIGDYFAGPNHIIPTNQSARYASPLNVEAFLKRSSLIEYSESALLQHVDKVADIARFEGLEAHARAVETRVKGGRLHADKSGYTNNR